MIKVEALASNPDSQDSFNCNVAIADEIHAFKTSKQYTLFTQAMKSYSNKLMIGITTAGDKMNSFCYKKLHCALKDDILILIPHCWFPIIKAKEKAEEDGIPLFSSGGKMMVFWICVTIQL